MNRLETFDLQSSSSDESKETCKGLIFRCERSAWVGHNDDVCFKTKFKLLKRKSCPGCEQCDFMWDDLREVLIVGYTKADTADPVIHNGRHGQLYKLEITNILTNWETGDVDDWDLEFKEYKEKECKNANK